jgi:hypothetical protein
MWNTLINYLPVTIILVIATIVCGADLIKAIKVWKQAKKDRDDKLLQDAEKKKQEKEALVEINHTLTCILEKLEKQDAHFVELDNKINDLTASDMHDIKSWIVEQYHKFYINQGWIDAFSADTLDHRYEDYKKEGGNSYIDTLVSQLHTLPMDPNLSSIKDKNQ